MTGYFNGIIICLAFLIGYHFFILRGLNYLKIYLVFIEIILLLIFWKSYSRNDIGTFSSNIVLQIGYILFLSIKYKKDLKKKALYKIIWSSDIVTAVATGLKFVDENNINYSIIIKIMENLLITKTKLRKKCYLFLSFDEEELIFRLLFLRKEDFELYQNEVNIDCILIEESEIVGKGYSVNYKYKF